MIRGWLTEDFPAGVQVMPLDDKIVHMRVDCPCLPRVEVQGTTCCLNKLAIRTITIHNALDGRPQ